MKTDYHIHTVVSDGFIIPEEIFKAAQKLGLAEISITDHDALGAYRHFDSDLSAQARSFGLCLVNGIELDSYFQGVEVHILGYHFNLDHPVLNEHLRQTQELRRKRIREQLAKINAHFGAGAIREDEVFEPFRDTVMKPHLVRTLMKKNLVPGEYRDVAKWISQNATTDIEVPKLPSAEMVRLVKRAGGLAVLAHPGFYIRENNLDLDKMLQELVPHGLDGVEVEYRYRGTAKVFPDLAAEKEMVEFVRAKTVQYGLRQTRGSDAHEIAELEAFHQ